jgi:hypothetical protein
MLASVFLAMLMLVSSHAQTSNTTRAQLSAKRSVHPVGTAMTHMTGSVEIVIPGGMKISADEAVVNRETGMIDLRGEVQLTVPPSLLR